MLSKFLIVILFWLAAIQIILCVPKTLRSREDDAQAAFSEYLKHAQQIMADLTSHVDGLALTQNEELKEQQSTTIDALNKKLDDVTSRISAIEENLKVIGITNCTDGYTNEIENQRIRLTYRAQRCTQLTSSIISATVNQTHLDMEELINNLMGCYNRLLGECKYYKADDNCYDYVIDNIAKANETMVTNYQLIKFNFDNKIASIKLPCQNLIEFEVSVYPDYNLQTINECAENSIRSSRSTICPQDSL